MTIAHAGFTILRAFLLGCGGSAIVIGATQITRTLRLGAIVTNPDAVILRAGIAFGIGVALIYGATTR